MKDLIILAILLVLLFMILLFWNFLLGNNVIPQIKTFIIGIVVGCVTNFIIGFFR